MRVEKSGRIEKYVRKEKILREKKSTSPSVMSWYYIAIPLVVFFLKC